MAMDMATVKVTATDMVMEDTESMENTGIMAHMGSMGTIIATAVVSGNQKRKNKRIVKRV